MSGCTDGHEQCALVLLEAGATVEVGNVASNHMRLRTWRAGWHRKKGDNVGWDDGNFFTCPITKEIIIDAVLADDGHMYERTSLEDWLVKSRERTSPVTRAPILDFFTVHGYETSLIAYASSVDQWTNHLDEKAREKARKKRREAAREETREEARKEEDSNYGATQEDDCVPGTTHRASRARTAS